MGIRRFELLSELNKLAALTVAAAAVTADGHRLGVSADLAQMAECCGDPLSGTISLADLVRGASAGGALAGTSGALR